MEIKKIEQHKFIRIIKYALDHESFTIDQICKDIGISQIEFNLAKYSMFHLLGEHEALPSPDLKLPWYLSSEAFFNYLSFLQYRDAIKWAQRALVVAIIAIFLSAASILLK